MSTLGMFLLVMFRLPRPLRVLAPASGEEGRDLPEDVRGHRTPASCGTTYREPTIWTYPSTTPIPLLDSERSYDWSPYLRADLQSESTAQPHFFKGMCATRL